jgi:small subunit ribosomal protein S4
MKIGPKYKICRRLGSGVFEKCQTQRYAIAEAQKGKRKDGGRRPRAPSDFGKQMLEKQRVRITYGISEKQFSGYVELATNTRGDDTASELLLLLESRLDNIVYRAGLAPTRRSARQMVSHGHVVVAGRRVTVPSYQMRRGMEFTLRETSRTKPFLVERMVGDKTASPDWISFDAKSAVGSICGVPTLKNTEVGADLSAIIGFYSR